MTLRLLVALGWLVAVAAPGAWWLAARRRVDIWRALPVPAALLGRDGVPLRRTGPADEGELTVGVPLPPRGHVTSATSVDGTPVRLTGVAGGALAVAVPGPPARPDLLGELAPRIAHDLATPLAAVTGHLDLIAHEPVSDVVARSVHIAQEQLRRVSALTHDLLTLTSVRAGSATRRRVDAGALAEEAVAAALPEADAAGAGIRVEIPAERVLVHAADGDLVRALRNLVRNALCHGLGAHRQVVVQVAADADVVTFAVADSGPGIPPAQLDAWSRPLVRGPAAAGEGSGLGLAIVAEVLAAHGSRLVSDGAGRLSFALARA